MKLTTCIFLFILITFKNVFAAWIYTEETDPITDVVTHGAAIKSDEGAILMVTCNENKLKIVIWHDVWEDLPEENSPRTITMTYRFDKFAPITEEWTFLVHFAIPNDANRFAQSLVDHSRLAMRPKGWPSADVFRLRGQRSKLHKVLSACS